MPSRPLEHLRGVHKEPIMGLALDSARKGLSTGLLSDPVFILLGVGMVLRCRQEDQAFGKA